MRSFSVFIESSCQWVQRLLVLLLETKRSPIAIQSVIGTVGPMNATRHVSLCVHHHSVRRYAVRRVAVNGLVTHQFALWSALDHVPMDHVPAARLSVALRGASPSAIQTVRAAVQIRSVPGSASQAHSARSLSVRWTAQHPKSATSMETSMPGLTALCHKELM